MYNNIQQQFRLPKIIEENEDVQTQAQSTAYSSNQGFFIPIVNKLAQFSGIIQKQHDVAASLSSNTFNADKMCKAVSSVMKVLKIYNLYSKIPSLDKLSGEVGQLRRILRVDRLVMLIKELIGFYKKKQLRNADQFMMIFKVMILLEDLSDLSCFLIQLKVIKKEHFLTNLRRNVANMYFLECVGWVIYHIRQYINAKNAEDKEQNKMAIIKYVLDGLVAHNDFAYNSFTINPEIASVLSLVSAFLNLYLVWK